MDIDIPTVLRLGQTAFAQRDYAAAETHFRAALAAGHTGAELHHHLGFLARERGDHDEAGARYADALEYAPNDPHLLNNLAEARRGQDRLGEAIALFRRARALAPEEAPIATNLGRALLAAKRPDLAVPELEAALAVKPGELSVMADYALCLCSLNRYADALPVYREMYRIQPSCNDARYLEALALLALGDFENGWRKHEVRWYARLGQELRHVLAGPYWTGEDDLSGKSILVHAEQGHGDTIMYLRFIPRLRSMAGRVVLEVHPALKALLAGTEDVFARGEDLPPVHLHCSFMSLPRCFRTTIDTISHDVPYLSAPPAALATWQTRLGAADGRRRIGVAWTGASSVWNRSIPLERLAPLLAREDCTFHILQTDMESGDRDLIRTFPNLIDHSLSLETFADTAAAVACMDLIVTVDTALAHLAGAMGKPVWTMLPFGAEYRWRDKGETTPWYPTMRLFRQAELNDWPGVIAAVNAALDVLPAA
ncbi:MAG TPA: tetratricopeptide repeat protein [Rhodopila sp.]|nr:tetratricopeptide repeat protein [Rhodopila sp.]